MSVTQGSDGTQGFDAIVVGAGFGGLCMLHFLRKLSLSVKVFEQGGGVGGTWYWNRYPGARCDSESVFYMFSERFSEELLDEWEWSERFAAQPEILRYLEFVTDRMDLRRDIQFNTRVASAVYDEARNRWDVETDDGTRATAQYLITAVGCLSSTYMPDIRGLAGFAGDWYHTGGWPQDGVDFTGRRVAVIGTGATGVQAIPEIAKDAAHVTVFQRTPSYAIAGGNRPLGPKDAEKVRATYPEAWEQARESTFGLPFEMVERSAVDVSPEERQHIYEAAWAKGGFSISLETFDDLHVNTQSNETAAEFIRSKIRETVDDPEIAELLSPTDHPFFTKRPPLEHGYYETFNRDNVALVDIRSTPIEEITHDGVRTTEAEYQVDTIVFATGFDAMTGTLFRMGIRGTGGRTLQSRWAKGPSTFLGITVHGFPNLYMIAGPQSPSVLSNMPVAIEHDAEWIADFIAYQRAQGYDYVEAIEEAEQSWVAHHNELAEATLLLGTDSWWVGANIPGKPRMLYPYIGGVGLFRKICRDVAEMGYEGFALQQRAGPDARHAVRSAHGALPSTTRQ